MERTAQSNHKEAVPGSDPASSQAASGSSPASSAQVMSERHGGTHANVDSDNAKLPSATATPAQGDANHSLGPAGTPPRTSASKTQMGLGAAVPPPLPAPLNASAQDGSTAPISTAEANGAVSGAPAQLAAAAPDDQREPASVAPGGTLMGLAPVPGVVPGAVSGEPAPHRYPPVTPAATQASAPEAPAAATPAPTTAESLNDMTSAPPSAMSVMTPALEARAKSGWLLIGVSTVLLVGLLLFAAAWSPPEPLIVSVHNVPERAGAAGSPELLKLRCGDCDDGTVARVNGHETTFSKHHAAITLKRPLPIGENTLKVHLERPGMGRDEDLTLKMPVHFRLRGDLSGLEHSPASVAVNVEAIPKTNVRFGQTTIELRNGRGRYEIPMNEATLGPEASFKAFERTIDFGITPPGQEEQSGNLKVAFAITPLVIDTPEKQLVTDNEHFTLAGRTAPDSVVDVAGSPIPIAEDGSFDQLMSIDAVGQTDITVTATSQGHAPRQVRLNIKRVASLAAEAVEFRKTAAESFSRITPSGTPQVGLAVAVEGVIERLGEVGGRTVTVLEMQSGCDKPPCVARVVHSRGLQSDVGSRITVYGHVTGGRRIATQAADGSETQRTVPEISALFSLPQ
jgi:hypothetical protein